MDDDGQMFGCDPDLSKRFGYALNQLFLLFRTSAFPHVNFNYGHITHLTLVRGVCAYLMCLPLILGFNSEDQVFSPLFHSTRELFAISICVKTESGEADSCF
jgi:hypothetical protein